MNANDRSIPVDVSWADYCDALASEAWLESRKRSLPARTPGTRVESGNDGRSAPLARELSALSSGG